MRWQSHLNLSKKQRLSLSSSDDLLIQHCCDIAWEAQTLALPNPSVGAIITRENGEILSKGVHSLAGTPHAEVIAIKQGYYALTQDSRILNLESSLELHDFLLSNHNGIFKNCSLYVSLEPCNHYGKTPPCANLIKELGFAKVIIGTKDSHTLASGGMQTLQEAGIHTSLSQIEQEAKKLLLPFEILRKKGRFVLFKIAMRLDGSYVSGQISAESSRIFTHNQRSVCDYLCISGATLRSDNPTLNVRYALPPYDKHKQPKLCLFSTRESNPRFHIFRHAQEIESLKGFVVVEGGLNLLYALREYIDMLLVHKAFFCIDSHLTQQSKAMDFELLHTMNLGKDLGLWLH